MALFQTIPCGHQLCPSCKRGVCHECNQYFMGARKLVSPMVEHVQEPINPNLDQDRDQEEDLRQSMELIKETYENLSDIVNGTGEYEDEVPSYQESKSFEDLTDSLSEKFEELEETRSYVQDTTQKLQQMNPESKQEYTEEIIHSEHFEDKFTMEKELVRQIMESVHKENNSLNIAIQYETQPCFLFNLKIKSPLKGKNIDD